MMPTLAIMAMAVASAATTTEERASAAVRLRAASRPSGPKSRRERREQGHAQAGENPRGNLRAAERDRRRPAAGVERVHGLRDQAHRRLRQQAPEQDAQRRAWQAEEQRFAQEQPAYPLAAGANG